MQVRHRKISNFRGIKSLDWHLDGNVLCLVGPGDLTKTTILDAIEYALAPRNTLPFADTDFIQGDIQEPIAILVTVGELPADLLLEDKLGTFQRGYRSGLPIFDDPEDGWESVSPSGCKWTRTWNRHGKLPKTARPARRLPRDPESRTGGVWRPMSRRRDGSRLAKREQRRAAA